MARRAMKPIIRGLFLIFAFPMAAASGFGKWAAGYTMFAHVCAMAPGILGDYLRISFYRLTLRECSLEGRVSYGSFFAHAEARLGDKAYVGANCIIGKAEIGARAQIASGVQILSGSHQHARGEDGEISGSSEGVFATISIGSRSWIGAGSIVMADVGAGTTIGAGSVVTHPIPDNSVAVGAPARVIRKAALRGPAEPVFATEPAAEEPRYACAQEPEPAGKGPPRECQPQQTSQRHYDAL